MMLTNRNSAGLSNIRNQFDGNKSLDLLANTDLVMETFGLRLNVQCFFQHHPTMHLYRQNCWINKHLSTYQNCNIELMMMLVANQDRYLRFLRWRVSSVYQARRDPEDILQMAFIKAWNSLYRYQESGMELDTWFFRIMNDVISDDHQRQIAKMRNRSLEINIPTDSGLQAKLGIVGQNHINESELREHERLRLNKLKVQVNTILQKLSHSAQQILILVFYSSLTVRQAAELIGITYEAAKKRYARARYQFRELWTELPGNED